MEVYDLSPAVPAKLANISTRAFVGTGSNIVIAGFILGGNSGDDRIVVRGIGPSLTALGCLMRWPIQRWSCATTMDRSFLPITTGRITQLTLRNSSPRVWPRQTNWSRASRPRCHRAFTLRYSRARTTARASVWSKSTTAERPRARRLLQIGVEAAVPAATFLDLRATRPPLHLWPRHGAGQVARPPLLMLAGTTSTGQGAYRTTCSATLPINTCIKPVRPCVDVMIISIFSFCA